MNRSPTPWTPRTLSDGDLGDAPVLYGFGVMAALALLALWWASRPFRRTAA